MERWHELPKDKTEIIHSVIAGSPNFISGSLSFFSVGSEIIFNNPNLSNKTANAGIWISGSSAYIYEVVRVAESGFDIDRYPLVLSGSASLSGSFVIWRRREIDKNFQEHHSSGLPHYY